MNSKLIAKLILITSLIGNFFIFPTPSVFAATYNMTTSANQVTPNGQFSVSIGSNDCTGRINISVSNGTASIGEIWVDQDYQSVTITAGNSGNVIVTTNPVDGFSDQDANKCDISSRTATVHIVAPAPQPTPAPKPPTPSKPNASASTSNNSSAANAADQKSDDNPAEEPKDETKSEDKTADDKSDEKSPSDSETPSATNPEEPAKPKFNLGQFFASVGGNLALAWTLAWIFFALFALTLAALVYVLIRHHKNLPLIPVKFQKSPAAPTIITPTPKSAEPKSTKKPAKSTKPKSQSKKSPKAPNAKKS